MRVKGHGLKHEGDRRYDQHGHYLGPTWYQTEKEKARPRHGLCQCGELSPAAPSNAAVKRWHISHKQQVLTQHQNGGAA